MLLGLSLWGVRRGCRALAVAQLVWEQGCCSESPGPRREQGPACHYRGPDKKSIPFQLPWTKPRPPGATKCWGPPKPSLARTKSSNSLSTQENIKTDGAAHVSLMNETQAEEGQPEGDLFPWLWPCAGYSWEPHYLDRKKQAECGHTPERSGPPGPNYPAAQVTTAAGGRERRGVREEGHLHETLTPITIFVGGSSLVVGAGPKDLDGPPGTGPEF